MSGSDIGGSGDGIVNKNESEDSHLEATTQQLGVEIVERLRSNTRLNYDVCAFNLVEILQLLGSRLPSFNSTSQLIIKSIEVRVLSLINLTYSQIYICFTNKIDFEILFFDKTTKMFILF